MVPELSVADAQKVDSSFSVIKRFERNDKASAEEREHFLHGKTWAPEYNYPDLEQLYDAKEDGDTDAGKQRFLMDRKADILRAVTRLELAKVNGEIGEAEAELYAALHEQQLKLIVMIEAANRLHRGTSQEIATAREAFMEMNRECYGELDQHVYSGMLRTEYDNLQSFTPQGEQAVQIKAELEQFFAGKELTETEPELLDAETMRILHEYVLERYANILAVVPDDDESVVYDAEQCRDIINRAFVAAGLSEKGWKAVIDPKRSVPNTAANKKKISLPSKMARTPSQLQRLILHEVEVHARRGQNGIDADSKILQKGTANYADAEEGFGVLLECILAGDWDNPSFHRARDRYIVAGLALGVGDAPRDSRQTFEIMWRLLAIRESQDGIIDDDVRNRAMDQAYVHVDNAFRGTNFAMPGIIYTKLKIYHEGMSKNATYFKNRLDDLDAAFERAIIGKCDHTNDTEVEQLYELAV